MYEFIPYIVAAVFIILGLIMALMPEKSTKKENRDSKEAIQKTKRNGSLLILCGFVLAVSSYLMR